MGTLSHQLKVLKRIVKSISVTVMDDFIFLKDSIKMAFHDVAVFSNSTPFDAYHPITRLINIANSTRCAASDDRIPISQQGVIVFGAKSLYDSGYISTFWQRTLSDCRTYLSHAVILPSGSYAVNHLSCGGD